MFDPFETNNGVYEYKLTQRQKEELDDYVEFALDEVLHNIGPHREKLS